MSSWGTTLSTSSSSSSSSSSLILMKFLGWGQRVDTTDSCRPSKTARAAALFWERVRKDTFEGWRRERGDGASICWEDEDKTDSEVEEDWRGASCWDWWAGGEGRFTEGIGLGEGPDRKELQHGTSRTELRHIVWEVEWAENNEGHTWSWVLT